MRVTAGEAGIAWAREFVIVVPYDAHVLEAARKWSFESGEGRMFEVRQFAFAATREIERRRGTK